MRFFVFAFAVIAAASAASLASDYLPPLADNSLLTQEYIAPELTEESAPLTDDGYRYKVVRKLRSRHRRDVNELPTNEYLPPVAESKPEVVVEAAQEAVVVETPAASEEQTVLADDGYRYKTVRRIRYRHRRDVNELPSNEYLPPVAESTQAIVVEAAPAVQEAIVVEAPAASEEQTVLADDGYRYKTVRRIRYRHRRDVNELPSNEYLPPVAESTQSVVVEAAPAVQEAVVVEAPAASEEQTVLADDGYRYKTVRRIRYRHRRDVNELPSNEYLPPVAESTQAVVVEAAPAVQEAIVVEAPAASEEQTVLANDGYRYKTVRRIRYRHRRDVNELPSNEYLPPVAESTQAVVVEAAPAVQESVVVEAPAASEEQTILADDGYRYKTVRRIRYRHRRDVNELPSNEYLPPVAESTQAVVVEAAPAVQEAVVVEAPAASEEQTVLADDGYRYKTVRRIRYRHRRDVNELPSNEYLPPVAESTQAAVVEAAPAVQEAVVVEAPAASEEQTVLADDGYRYKTVRRIRYRHRRDVNELPSNEYLPPVAESTQAVVVEAAPAVQEAVVVEAPAASEEQTVLADDGYRYKTVRRIRYRHRRDVNELPSNEYLPPVAESTQAAVVEAAPAVQEAVVVEAPAASEEQTVLADDGYRYKTVRRIRYRHRRDVNELPSNEYLPPVAESTQAVVVEAAPAVQEAVVVEAPAASEEQTVLADDGYRYKTVRRIRYRHRRDVNELPSNEYLPPVAESTQAVVVEAAPAVQEAVVVDVPAASQETAALADDGYRYKTVRRIRYRHRRDVSELLSNEYLPPVVTQAEEIASVVSVPETVLADDGYRYKAVRRLKHRRH